MATLKLSDLNPRGIQGGGFSFLCPKCKTQRIVIQAPWQWEGDWNNLTMHPSYNANPAHAHFDIKEGKILMSDDDKSLCKDQHGLQSDD